MAKKKITKEQYTVALQNLEKNFGKAFNARAISDDCYDAISTGCDELDDVLTRGARGVYLGGIIELFGPEGSGKTSMAFKMVAQSQIERLPCCWIDAESGFSPDLAMINGINLDELVMPDLEKLKRKDNKSPIPNAGEILDCVYESVMSGGFGLVVVDSVAGLSPARVLAADYDPNKFGMSEIARALSEQLSKISHACYNKQTSVIFINQLRMKPGDTWNPEDTPGGRALKFFAHQRIRVDRISGEDGEITLTEQDESGAEKDRIIGHYARLRIKKNKRATPFKEPIIVPIYYEKYNADDAKRTFDFARKLLVMTTRSGTYTWKDGEEIVFKSESEKAMLTYLRSDLAILHRLAANCVTAEVDEKNKKKEEPVVLTNSVRQLASFYVPVTVEEKKSGKKKKKVKPQTDLE